MHALVLAAILVFLVTFFIGKREGPAPGPGKALSQNTSLKGISPAKTDQTKDEDEDEDDEGAE